MYLSHQLTNPTSNTRSQDDASLDFKNRLMQRATTSTNNLTAKKKKEEEMMKSQLYTQADT